MLPTRRAIFYAGLATAAFAPASAAAAPSDLDLTFGQAGKAVLPFTTGPVDVKVQPDGKLVVVGSTPENHIGVWRINPDGTPDRSFDDDGAASVDFGTDSFPAQLAIQADGKIVVSGRATGGTATAIARLTAAGELDAGFDPGNGDGDGRKLIPQDAAEGYYNGGLLPQPDGRLLLAGRTTAGTTADFAVLVLKENGALDPATYEPADFDGRDDGAERRPSRPTASWSSRAAPRPWAPTTPSRRSRATAPIASWIKASASRAASCSPAPIYTRSSSNRTAESCSRARTPGRRSSCG